jgi:hypothetical protein
MRFKCFIVMCGLVVILPVLSILNSLSNLPVHAATTPKKATLVAAPTVTGVVVKMSDGTEQAVTLGTWLSVQNGQLRITFPLQYVNQIAILQPDNSWKYPKPGRNVQVWRNGVLQQEKVDYTLDSPGMRVIPLPITLVDGTAVPIWNTDDLVSVAFIY